MLGQEGSHGTDVPRDKMDKLSPRAYFFCRPEASAEGSPLGTPSRAKRVIPRYSQQDKVEGDFFETSKNRLANFEICANFILKSLGL